MFASKRSQISLLHAFGQDQNNRYCVLSSKEGYISSSHQPPPSAGQQPHNHSHKAQDTRRQARETDSQVKERTHNK